MSEDNQSTGAEEKPSVIRFLESDATLNIAIVLAVVGVFVMGVFTYLLEGMARVHLGVVTFLFFGLFVSLLLYLCIK